jgi:hypothetical protein
MVSDAAANGGSVALTHSQAISLGPDVPVDCVSPGWIDVAPCEHHERMVGQRPRGQVGSRGIKISSQVRNCSRI